ncbi:tautomerase family protein [Bremerella sp. P1]|uniref:tautomerase family protein n=1 Tax=Bremerella sp. P1 TaxID=3026424 RepID=UPI0023675ACB|nr:tautomerase family protein [Bremerella sp. P1]WDI39903.1 tautomerase family protein [Bremerella sp. P1]
MPHIIVKLWPGKSDEQKQQLAERITKDVIDVLHNSEASISVAFEEVEASQWGDKVYKPDILAKPEQLYKKPGYDMGDL